MTSSSPSRVLVHAVWATARREPLLPAAFDDTLAEMLGRKAGDVGCVLLSVGSASDHVHVLMRLSAAVALASAMQRLKGASAYDINRQHLLPERLAWQVGFWAESFGASDTQPILEYLRNQRSHHANSHLAEPWENANCESAEGGL